MCGRVKVGQDKSCIWDESLGCLWRNSTPYRYYAGMVEQADTLDSKSGGDIRAGSSPASSTIK